jgi:hypothetical protein
LMNIWLWEAGSHPNTNYGNFKDHVYLWETAADYIQLIEKILTDDSEKEQQGRIAFAQSHTWENNVNEIGKAILTKIINQPTSTKPLVLNS